MSSSSSSSSSSSERDDHNGIDVAGPSTRRPRRAPGGGSGGVGRSRGRGRGRGRDRGVGGGDSEGPSSSRRRRNNAVWPEPIVETLAVQVAIDAARSFGRLAAAAALANVFQVCSTWRAVSRSDLLWNRIARRIWGRTHLRQDTWREEYIYWHRTAANFQRRRSAHAVLHFNPSDPPGGDPDALVCRCLSLSDTHLACGYADGAVRLFDLLTRRHVRTFRPLPHNFLGRFSRAVTGIILPSLDGPRHHHSRLVFGTLDGDIHVAAINGPPTPRLAYEGQVVDDGALVDFTGCERWWIGLYAGAPGRSFRVWDGNTENVLYTEGTLTDLESRTGWEMLIELTHVVGRVRVTSQESAMACTRSRAIAFDPRSGPNQGNVEVEDGLVVTSFDVSDSAYVFVNSSGLARVRRVGALEDVCSFSVRRGAWQRGLMGCMNRGYALMCAGGVIRVWEIELGQYLYRFAEEIEEVNALVADERHVVASSVDGTLHIWDFGAQ